MKRTLLPLVLITTFVLVTGCGKREQSVVRKFSEPESTRITQGITAFRAGVDSFFRYSPDSPFRTDSGIHYDGTKWFPPDLQYYFQSKLYRYIPAETVTVYGTKGEPRTQLKYGFFTLHHGGKEHTLNVYKVVARDPAERQFYATYLSVWFTDRTTGKETYDVGRYINIDPEQRNPENVYAIDFNKAYNPYCAYNPSYSCAIPRKEDHLDLAIRAGEMKYHE